ncbi:MAG: PP2C family protein-serine/threonine phosphatase [Desulfatibacillaceae bacterium]
MSVVVESAGLTDVGQKRKGNEDSLYVDDDLLLYVVADGMGGHQAGEVASQLVVSTIKDYFRRWTDGEDVEPPLESETGLSEEAGRLLSSIHLANKGVHNVSETKQNLKGMGSTVSVVMFADDTIIAANVGDSPIFLIHDGEIETISVPHTVMAEQASMNPEAAMHMGEEFRHMLTRAMGIESEVETSVSEIQCFPGDILVISSDGLTDKVSPEEILEVVSANKPEKSCRMLVDMANERGGDDNITVVVVGVKAVKRNEGGLMGVFARIRDFFIK